MTDGRINLIFSMRGKWGHRLGTTKVESLFSFVEGYAQAKSWAPDNTWEAISRWVHSYLKIDVQREFHWTEQISRKAPDLSSEISLLYAAIDYAQSAVYVTVLEYKSSDTWRRKFLAAQQTFNTLRPNCVQSAPHKLEICKTGNGSFWLFYFSKDHLRYEERTALSKESLVVWAEKNRFLSLPASDWVAV